jgi:hypothetical protein|uniref:RING-type E3 ubiquitin transferase n=1 Tax=Eutreptiella gymnastica TaxID=73025 RepID=A0A7S4GHV6_9EUGL
MINAKGKTLEDVGEEDPSTPLPANHIGEYRDDTCSICLEQYEGEINPAMLYVCGHAFHLQCAETWRQRSNSCPLCWNSLIEAGVYFETGESALPMDEILKVDQQNNLSLDVTETETDEEEQGLVHRNEEGSDEEGTEPQPTATQLRTQKCRRCLWFCC